LKWVGSKQRLAPAILAAFPDRFGTYHEPFLGAGGVLGALAPDRGYGSDIFAPLVEIWQTLAARPDRLAAWYAERWQAAAPDPRAGYEAVRAAYNARPNGADLLYLCRACYGGVVRFRRRDGAMSTPVGAHPPLRPEVFAARVAEWHVRVRGVTFDRMDFAEAMARAAPGDLVYCDPPYAASQTILYGAQAFALPRLWEAVEAAVARGVRVALSIDGTAKSGARALPVTLPPGLFARELAVGAGRSMLRRFQLPGQSLEGEEVADRLLLSW
jgi:DNA adenine methylase